VVGWLVLLAAVPGVLVYLLAQSLGIIEVLVPGLVWTLIVASLVGLFTVLVAVRRAWAVATAVAVVAVVTVMTAALTRFDGTVGERIEQPSSMAELDVPDMAAGRLVLDLTELQLPPGVTSIPIDMGVGRMEIVVPTDVQVRASATVGAGQAEIFGSTRSGVSVELTRVISPQGATTMLDFDLELRAGQVRVCQEAPGRGGQDGCGVQDAGIDVSPRPFGPNPAPSPEPSGELPATSVAPASVPPATAPPASVPPASAAPAAPTTTVG